MKYDILKHPNLELSADGKADIYEHGKVNESITNIEVIRERKTKDEIGQVEIENKYIVLTSYQIESYLREEKENEERKFEQENNEKGESRNDENEY